MEVMRTPVPTTSSGTLEVRCTVRVHEEMMQPNLLAFIVLLNLLCQLGLCFGTLIVLS
jgi:hypothetical protein